LNIDDAEAPIRDEMDERAMETKLNPLSKLNNKVEVEEHNNFIQAFYSLNLP
jgi:hypothetical protein